MNVMFSLFQLFLKYILVKCLYTLKTDENKMED